MEKNDNGLKILGQGDHGEKNRLQTNWTYGSLVWQSKFPGGNSETERGQHHSDVHPRDF